MANLASPQQLRAYAKYHAEQAKAAETRAQLLASSDEQFRMCFGRPSHAIQWALSNAVAERERHRRLAIAAAANAES